VRRYGQISVCSKKKEKDLMKITGEKRTFISKGTILDRKNKAVSIFLIYTN